MASCGFFYSLVQYWWYLSHATAAKKLMEARTDTIPWKAWMEHPSWPNGQYLKKTNPSFHILITNKQKTVPKATIQMESLVLSCLWAPKSPQIISVYTLQCSLSHQTLREADSFGVKIILKLLLCRLFIVVTSCTSHNKLSNTLNYLR